jgi:hypothetical protein
VNNLHGALHRALEDALRLELIHRNVTEMVRPPRRSHYEMCILSAEQARALLSAVQAMETLLGLSEDEGSEEALSAGSGEGEDDKNGGQ